MGDISTWNPVDNSNTTAPPDGWPEGMAPSAVNNSARAMMGAVRRWYDTVAVQIAGMLPLTGGTLTGNLTGTNITLSGTVTAAQLTGSNALVTGTLTTTTINASGTITAAQLTSTGNINAGGSIAAVVDMQGRDLIATRNISAVGTVTGTSFIGNVSVPANGPITTGGTVTGGTVTSTGNITATSGTVSSANVTASSNVTAAGSVTGGSMHCSGTMQVDGQTNLLQTLNVGPSGGYARFDGVGTYNVSGSWLTFSDRAVKQEATITPYERGLEAIMALRPCAYRYRPELFGAEEAEQVRYGLVADEVAPVVPEMVGEAVFGGRTLQTLNTGHLNIVLLNACRELAAQNTALATRLALLEAEFGAPRR